MKMQAPEGTTSAAVESTQYEVDSEGLVEVENGEHIPHLERHGFTQVVDDSPVHSDPLPEEIGPCPDFTRFANRQALVDWLAAHGHEADATDLRANLEQTCVEHHGRLVSGEATRLPAEVSQEPVPTEGEGEDEDEDEEEDKDPDAVVE